MAEEAQDGSDGMQFSVKLVQEGREEVLANLDVDPVGANGKTAWIPVEASFETGGGSVVVALETSELVGKPLREVDLQSAVIGAIVRGEEVIIPTGDDVIEVGDHVVIFALRSAISRLERQMMVQLRYF